MGSNAIVSSNISNRVLPVKYIKATATKLASPHKKTKILSVRIKDFNPSLCLIATAKMKSPKDKSVKNIVEIIKITF